METISSNACFGGTQHVIKHASSSCACDMTFALFLPTEAQDGPVPVLWFLSGLTCTHENAMVKAGAQAWAAEQGIALVFPDTSPRGVEIEGDRENWDFGCRIFGIKLCSPHSFEEGKSLFFGSAGVSVSPAGPSRCFVFACTFPIHIRLRGIPHLPLYLALGVRSNLKVVTPRALKLL